MPSRRRLAGFALIVVLGLAACGQGRSPATGGSAANTAAPSGTGATAGPTGTASGGEAQANQTDTEWGRIWDTLPGNFPTYPGSSPGEETATGPASANLVVDGLDAKGITTLLQTLLQQAGFTTAGLSGPLENGGYVLDMTGSVAGCKIRVSAAPAGGLTTLTILYGAACPHG